MANPGEYDLTSFTHHWSEEGKGQHIYDAREILGEAVEAMSNGTIAYWLPSIGVAYDPEYVSDAVAQIERRWQREAESRGRDTTGAPPFTELPYLQQTALVERLRAALGKD